MPRYALILEYDGAPFKGWQRQSNGPSVQAAIEDAIEGFTGTTARVVGAGRTDAGVHALAQVAHVDLDEQWPLETIRAALNHHLRPAPIAVLEVRGVAPEFHARFSAVERSYVYVIVNRPARPVLLRGQAWHVPVALSAVLMHEAGQALVGRHDFTSFRSADCQAASPEKTLDWLAVTRDGERIEIRLRARSFLHHQVRNIAGSLRLVGDGRWPVHKVGEVLAARSRAAAGPTAPAHGLHLAGIAYPGFRAGCWPRGG